LVLPNNQQGQTHGRSDSVGEEHSVGSAGTHPVGIGQVIPLAASFPALMLICSPRCRSATVCLFKLNFLMSFFFIYSSYFLFYFKFN
jgi:hypothetical protein